MWDEDIMKILFLFRKIIFKLYLKKYNFSLSGRGNIGLYSHILPENIILFKRYL